MSRIPPFLPSALSFEDRIGDPEAFDAAVGLVTLGFAWLEDRLSDAIRQLLGVDASMALSVTSEMSFRNKVNLFGSLARLKPRSKTTLVKDEDPEGYLRELVGACFECEELRNQILHSSWSIEGSDVSAIRRRYKTTAKAMRGIHHHEEDLTAAAVLDIYDYILNIDYVVEEFMLTYYDES